ncbi:ABC transporter substrate-binding protein [Thauera sinica]|uniref:ABC transporter substrate-binding protein n=1 Tax=Thauera sinica TaxID=2665146 RepID=A0ABW1AKF9_9RHOO|nr:ABC transporter substrate-binding protein [Thauera sp. K11]ATE59827.1 hypothetical protein CCZ27_07565 [Thauera sp. K11]
MRPAASPPCRRIAHALRLLPLALAAAGPGAGTAAATPQRIVSLNLCTDQILLQLVGRERIAALTHLSQDAFSAALHEQARGLPTVRGNAEEVLALSPDLVLVGTYTTRHTTAMLRRYGIPVVAVPGASSFADVADEIRTVARAVGEEARGEAIIGRFNARLAELAAKHREPRPVATQFASGGYSAGSGTLYHDIFAAAGHDNGAARAGLAGYGILPLERLVGQAPDILVGSDYRRGTPTLGNRLLQHPAIANLGAREVVLPARLTICGGPWNLDAAALLAAGGSGR